MNDMISIIDNALRKGYSVAWAADVSEKYFSWKNGVAYVPEKDYYKMTAEEREAMFNGPKPEMEITPDIRQQGYDNVHNLQGGILAWQQAGLPVEN